MEKHTDRILWSVLILALGISLFVFGKPALTNLTNQVLHHDDLKATMQTPASGSLSAMRLKSVNGSDAGMSSRAYVLGSTTGISHDLLWNISDAHQLNFPEEIRKVPIPYGSYVKVKYQIKVSSAVDIVCDVSNQPETGNSWHWNDNDDFDKRVFLLDNTSIPIGGGQLEPSPVTLAPNVWHTIEVEYPNTSPFNSQHIALYDKSCLRFINDHDINATVQVKNFIYGIDDVKYLTK